MARHQEPNTEIKMRWVILIAVVSFLLGFLMGSMPAGAHDANRPELNQWFKGLSATGNNMPCCSGSDAVVLKDVDWESKDGHFRVRLDGEWVDVPDAAVVKEPNLDGQTLVWPYYMNGKLQAVRCFMPGAQG